MNDCEKYQELISMMLDGELSESEAQQLREHIAECPHCRDMYDAFAAVSGAVAADAAEVPAHLHEKIMDGVKAAAKPAKKRGIIIKLRPYMSAAACLVVVVGLFAMSRNGFGAEKLARDMPASAPAAAADTALTDCVEAYAYVEQSSGAGMKSEPTAEESVMCDAVDASAAPEAPAAPPMPMPEYGEKGEDDICGLPVPYLWDVELESARVIIDGLEKEVSDPYALRNMLGVVSSYRELNVTDIAEGTGKVILETVDATVEILLWFTDEYVFVKSNWLYPADPDTAVYIAKCSPDELRAVE